MKKGYFQIYTGNGKGKTTAALGLAFRAMGQGLRIYMGQFMKGRVGGEHGASMKLAPLVTIEQYGRRTFAHKENLPQGHDISLVKKGLKKVMGELSSGKYDIVILDEIITAHSFGLVTLEELLEIVSLKPKGVELVFTGRGAPSELIAKADLVTEMKEIKHYYRKGVKARKGIEL